MIGPRGSGKSTLAEALRIALGGVPPGITKPRQEFIRATLGGAVLTVTTAPRGDRGPITIRRVVGQEPTLTGADGRPLTAIDLDRGTVLPLDAYSGPEIEAIADENIGSRRKALLDDLSRDELQPIHMALAELGRSLEGNADAIASARKRVAGLTEQIEELRDARTALDALPPSPEKAASPEFTEAAQQHSCNEKEKKAAGGAITALGRFEAAVSSAVTAAESDLRNHVAVAGSANGEITGQVDIALTEYLAAVKRIGRRSSTSWKAGRRPSR